MERRMGRKDREERWKEGWKDGWEGKMEGRMEGRMVEEEPMPEEPRKSMTRGWSSSYQPFSLRRIAVVVDAMETSIGGFTFNNHLKRFDYSQKIFMFISVITSTNNFSQSLP